MILLLLHSQDTMGINHWYWRHWAGSASNTSDARGDVFGKQAGFVFAKFLLLS